MIYRLIDTSPPSRFPHWLQQATIPSETEMLKKKDVAMLLQISNGDTLVRIFCIL